MVIKIKNKLSSLWCNLNFPGRIIAMAVLFVIMIGIVASLIIVHLDNLHSRNKTSSLAEQAISFFTEVNEEALNSGRYELINTDNVDKRSNLSKIVFFDTNGNIAFPLSVKGGKFRDSLLFQKLMSEKDELTMIKRDKYYEVFKAVYSRKNDATGLIYLEIIRRPSNALIWSLVIILCTSVFGAALFYWIFLDLKKTIATEGVNPEYELIKRKFSESRSSQVREINGVFESDWRRLIHVVDYPVIILDKLFRLVELNSAALNVIDNSEQIVEGRHIIDVINNKRLRTMIAAILDKNDFKPGCSVSKKNITIFSSQNEMGRCKYAFLFHGS